MRSTFTVISLLLFSFCFAQNVGIGITTPAAPLHIRNNGPELFRIQGNDPYLSFFNNSGVARGFVQSHGDNLNLGTSTGNAGGYIQFFNNNNLNMVIHPNSNVGIGTNGPNFKLTVQTSNDNYGVIHRSNDIIVGTWIGYNSGIAGGWYGTYTDHPLMFFTKNGGPQITLLQNGNVGIGITEPMGKLDINGTLLTTGNVGIGTSNPIAKLHVVSDGEALRLSGSDTYFTLYNGAGLKGYIWNKNTNDIELGTDDTNPGGNLMLSIMEVPRLVVQNDGRVRIGMKASIHGNSLPMFTVNGSLCIKDPGGAEDEWFWAANSITTSLYLSKNGNSVAWVEHDGDWTTFSDMSLKENIKLYKSVLGKISKLEISTYSYKREEDNRSSFGLIAQNVVQYFPEIVSEAQDKHGQKILGISYAKTGVLAIKAIQEQQEKIETQQKKIDELEKRLAILESNSK